MPQTILIGTIDPNITYLLQRYAEESGFETAHVSQSDDVFALAFRLQPALVILDVELLEQADREVLRRLKGAAATREIPIIIYSYLDEPPDDWRDRADGYLPKSALYDDFVGVLKRALAPKPAPRRKEASIG